MEELLIEYKNRLKVLKDNRAETVDTNTDAENYLYDCLIKQLAGICSDLNKLLC